MVFLEGLGPVEDFPRFLELVLPHFELSNLVELFERLVDHFLSCVELGECQPRCHVISIQPQEVFIHTDGFFGLLFFGQTLSEIQKLGFSFRGKSLIPVELCQSLGGIYVIGNKPFDSFVDGDSFRI